MPPAPVQIPPVIVDPTITKQLGWIHKDAQEELYKLASYYGLPVDDIEDRHWLRLDKILRATSLAEARQIARKTWDSLFTNLMVLWGAGKIAGPPTLDNIERKLKKAEAWIKFHEAKGNTDVVAKQKAKADEFRKQLTALGGRAPPVPWEGITF
jgi:hypothetical protein